MPPLCPIKGLEKLLRDMKSQVSTDIEYNIIISLSSALVNTLHRFEQSFTPAYMQIKLSNN
nr:MAG TPA: hypothetical protein [Caudoviricetes sp.]